MRLIPAALAACAFVFAASAEETPPPVSPACALLTAAEATQVLGHEAMVGDGGAEQMGSSSCSWVDMETYNAIGVNLIGGEVFAGSSAEAYYESTKQALGMSGKTEDVAVGDKAFLLDSSGAITVTVLKGDKILSINGSGVPKEKMIETATLMVAHL